MEQVKVALLSKEFAINGGVGMYLQQLCKALVDAGHEVSVIHSDSSNLAARCGVNQFYVERFDEFTNGLETRRRATEVINILSGLQPDIVHIQGHNNFLLEHEIRQQFPAIKTLHVYDFCPAGNKFHHLTQKQCDRPTGPLCVARMVYKRCSLSKRPSVILQLYQRAVIANRNNSAYHKLIVASQYVKHQAIATGYRETQIEVLPYFTNLP
jgi:hypothetical protein